METSALNVAHEKQRRADALLREGKFEEAAKCHENAASLLSEARAQLENSFVDLSASSSFEKRGYSNSNHTMLGIESLALQEDHHKRQAGIVRMKQEQYEFYKTSLDKQKQDLLPQSSFDKAKDGKSEEESLRQAIYKTIEEQDSLLGLISLPEKDEQAFKHPKDTGTVIEELRTVNVQLRSLVGSLLNQLEAKEKEVERLQETLRTLVVNPGEANRASDTHDMRLSPLPPLAPLEMPKFDFTEP